MGRPSFVAERVGHLGRLAERVAELEEAGRTVVAVSRDRLNAVLTARDIGQHSY